MESNTVVLIHDAFQSLSYWDGFMVDGYDGVAMDTHIYQMFSNEVCILFFMTQQRINDVNRRLPTTIPSTSRRRAVMGLASPALTCG
jgi:hypothetical protein